MSLRNNIMNKIKDLQTKWPVTLEPASEPYYDSELTEKFAQILQEEIDWELMMGVLKSAGWTGVEMQWSERTSETTLHEIKEWCKNTLKGNYKGRGKLWVFEYEKDASQFILKWA